MKSVKNWSLWNKTFSYWDKIVFLSMSTHAWLVIFPSPLDYFVKSRYKKNSGYWTKTGSSMSNFSHNQLNSFIDKVALLHIRLLFQRHVKYLFQRYWLTQNFTLICNTIIFQKYPLFLTKLYKVSIRLGQLTNPWVWTQPNPYMDWIWLIDWVGLKNL